MFPIFFSWEVVSYNLFNFYLLLMNKFPAATLFANIKSFLFEQSLFIFSVWLYGILFSNDFGCYELMLNKVWWLVFFLNVLVGNLLFLKYISISRNYVFSSDISHSNLIDGCFAFNNFRVSILGNWEIL